MTQVPPVKNIYRSSIKEMPKWFEVVLDFLNTFCETTWTILNRGITIGDNVSAVITDQTFTTESNYSSGIFVSLSFSCSFNPKLIQLIRVDAADESLITGSIVISDWDYNSAKKNIEVNYIAGLVNSKEYTVRIIAWQ